MTPTLLNVIGGERVAADAVFPDLDPVDGSLVAHVAEADAAVVDRAVRSARSALAGPWGRTTVADRAQVLRRAAEVIERRFDELVAAEVADTGKPVAQARALDVGRAAANFRAFAELGATAGTALVSELPGGGAALNYGVRTPLGVVAVIVPWNLPLLLLTWKVAPALACGNTVVVKPSDLTPATATLLADVLDEAGLPPGAYNVVHGGGAGSAGQHLVEHPGIDAVTFTGSTATGTAILRAVAPRVRPVSFELGGKNSALVFADADLDRAVAGLARSLFLNAGQVCLCTERVLVQRPVLAELAARLTQAARDWRPGRPADPATTLGPLISADHRAKVDRHVRSALDLGAELLCGGPGPQPVDDDLPGGYWFAPTLWTGLGLDAAPMREEIFGPVGGLVPFDTEEEAVALATDTEYGLAASVWTSDVSRAHRVAGRLRVGTAWINSWYVRDLRAPFGGVGMSGVGREGGTHSLEFYTQLTNVCVAL